MNLLADEGVDRPIVELLRSEGHQVVYIAELTPGIDDSSILEQANAGYSLLLTLDKDFGELVFRQGLVHAGVVLIRLSGLQTSTKARIVASALQMHGVELLDSFSVIAPGSIRVRKRESGRIN